MRRFVAISVIVLSIILFSIISIYVWTLEEEFVTTQYHDSDGELIREEKEVHQDIEDKIIITALLATLFGFIVSMTIIFIVYDT